jgi:AGZA family xanthine/uracil permease-like MFS transporter
MWASIVAACNSYFLLTERGTTMGTEFRAGTASFLTLSYLLLVNPQIMVQAGVPHDDAVFATALSATVSCLIIGLCGNLPFGCAPGLGLSAYLTFGLVQADLCTLPEALSACWWSGIFVLLISLSGGSAWLMRVVPESIKYAIVVGMGLLIAMIGLVSVGIIQGNAKTIVELGNVIGEIDLQLCLAGILLVASLLYHDVKGAILIAIAVLTVVDWAIHDAWPTQIFQVPVFHSNDYWQPSVLFDLDKASVLYPAVGAFVLICIFDISGVMFGLATLGGIIKEDGEIPGSMWAFIASGAGTLLAAWTGSTPIIVCVETASGVREGGRTGLTAVVIGLYFAASLFLAPLFSSVPDMATAPVLVMVGVMMMGESAKINWERMNDALPCKSHQTAQHCPVHPCPLTVVDALTCFTAFLTIILMPLTYSITNGMIFGLLMAGGFYFTTGQFLTDAKTMHRKLSRLESSESQADVVVAKPLETYPSYGAV